MKIAAFFSDSPFASWGQSRGLPAVLRRMGHDLVDIPVPPAQRVTTSQIAKINKPIADCELILVSGPEHLRDWINQFYPQWDKLKAPKVGWYHESFHAREDYSLTYENFRAMFDYHLFPDKDDAEKYKGAWLPLGVDTKMFNSPFCDCAKRGNSCCSNCGSAEKRDIDCAFIGLMYPKRQRFYEELKPFLKGIPLRVNSGNVVVHGIDGMDVERTAKLMAETYRRIKVFVTFPAVCNVLVAKILESMASGCYLVAPTQPLELKNYAAYSNAKECAKKIREALELAPYREKIARAGCEEVHSNHRLESRLEAILALVGVPSEAIA